LLHHQRHNGVRRGDAGILSRFLAWLGQTGAVAQHGGPAVKGPRQNVAHQFRRYLLEERGLSTATLQNYVPSSIADLQSRQALRRILHPEQLISSGNNPR
jgi:hypothetical protein